MVIRAATAADRDWLRARIDESWGLPVVSPVAVYDHPEQLEALIAEDGAERVGAVTWSADAAGWEVVTLHALRPRQGIGRALMDAVRDRAEATGATRVWLVTTDDNPTGVEFYAAIGMRRVRELPGFSAHVRRHKPDPQGAEYDALEYEWKLSGT